MINREELKEKYRDEEVLVVPLEVIKRLELDLEGYNKKSVSSMTGILLELTKQSYYIPRWKSDSNPEEVELISYISFHLGDTIFTYKRIKNGDSRGDGALSIGVGGHINPVDVEDPIYSSAYREVAEEIGLYPRSYNIVPTAFIRCTKTDYDRDHLGIHFKVNYAPIIDSVAEKDKMLPLGAITRQALETIFHDKLENWSRIIIDNK